MYLYMFFSKNWNLSDSPSGTDCMSIVLSRTLGMLNANLKHFFLRELMNRDVLIVSV